MSTFLDLQLPEKSVHIVLSDKGWILERLAKELADRLPYISHGLETDPAATIQYYVTYGCRGERVSPIEVALFTHREEDAKAAARFDQVAQDVDHAIAMSSTTDRLLEGLAETEHSCISPGVDLDRFRPRLKIAVVGRTYHTGRKGEALVQAVMDIPDIDWHFTGEGWPGPAENIADEDLPAFYRAMDYILVPALNEGGPMSILEALASGVPVIASAVGWVPDFPHIPFERGNANSLRDVLLSLREERFALRDSVTHMTWDRWAEEHDRLFDRLLATARLGHAGRPPEPLALHVRSAALATHGIEDTTLGGPSVRAPATVRALRTFKINARLTHNRDARMEHVDIVHGFNVWVPNTAVALARHVKRIDKPLVFSPIMLDLSEGGLWRADQFRAFRRARSADEADALMQWYQTRFNERLALLPPDDPEPGYSDTVREIAELADSLIFLSEHERAYFHKIVGACDTPGYLVHNPVDADRFQHADRDLFRNHYGLADYVLCVARLETRKNQLMLAAALSSTTLPLVLIGHSTGDEYLRLVRRFAGPNLTVIDRLEPGSPMLRSAIAGARVFALPSWAEGAPLAALEAAAAGANLVLSDRSGEREYFESRARYCDPASMQSIRDEILEAWERPLSKTAAADLSGFVKDTYSWERHARSTLGVYETTLERFRAEAPQRSAPPSNQRLTAPLIAGQPASEPRRGIVMDVSTWAHHGKKASGIMRVERSVALSLFDQPDTDVTVIMYVSSTDGFIEVPRAIIDGDMLAGYISQVKTNSSPARKKLALPKGADLIAVGSSWMQNADYALELCNISRENDLTLSILMHDLTPALFPHWYLQGYSQRWEQNCAFIIARSDRILVYSENTRRDVENFATKKGIDLPIIGKIRLADEIGTLSETEVKVNSNVKLFAHRPFVLSVGAIHVRKNYGLLYEVWLMLREKMGDACPHLVIVGGVSWNGEETARMMREDERVKRYIHIIEEIDDGTLAWLYENALMTVYPSFYEGWGLPVGESLAHGKICLSSKTSSMSEIAPSATDLLDPMDRNQWAARIRFYATSASARRQREAEIQQEFEVTTWDATTKTILAALEAKARPAQPNTYNYGEIVLTTSLGTKGDFLGSGWYPRENWGTWAKGAIAKLEVNPVHETTEDLVLTVLAKVLKPAVASIRCDVRVNGAVVGSWSFPPSPAKDKSRHILVNRVHVPKAVANARSALHVQFELDQTFFVSEVSPGSSDRRKMGLGVCGFLIEPLSRSSDATALFNVRSDVRAALSAPATENLEATLTDSVYRPSVRTDIWIRNLSPFIRSGAVHLDFQAKSVNDALQLAFGQARLRYDRPAYLDLMLQSPAALADQHASIALFCNDRWIKTFVLEGAAPEVVSAELPTELLEQSDPALISLYCSGLRGGDGSTFFVSALRIRQGLALPSDRTAPLPLNVGAPIGLDIVSPLLPAAMLSDGWHPIEPQGVWSIGSLGRIRLSAIPAKPAPTLLSLHISRRATGRDDDTIVIVRKDGSVMTEIGFESGPIGTLLPAQRVNVPLTDADDGVADVRFVPNNQDVPMPSGPGHDPRQLGVMLFEAGLHRLESVTVTTNARMGLEKTPHMSVLGAWLTAEEGGRWGSSDRLSLLFRTDKSMRADLSLRLSSLATDAVDQENRLHVLVDGQHVHSMLLPPLLSDEQTVTIPVKLNAGLHLIELQAPPPVTPKALGLSDDVRELNIWLHEVSFAPSATAHGSGGFISRLPKPLRKLV